MPTCALCESTQAAGDACDVCGRPFPPGEVVPDAIAPLPDLEVTRFAVGEVFVERLAELEPTMNRAAGAVAAGEAVEGFSATAAPPVQVAVEPLEVERVGDDAVLEGDDAPGPVRCRYCLTIAEPGTHLCPRCGMRLPLDRRPPPAADATARPCSDCGVAMTGPQCPACGARR